VSAGGNRTSGSKSILGGNQVVAPITAPINRSEERRAGKDNGSPGWPGGAEDGKGKGRTIDHGYREGGGRLPSSDRKGWRKGKTATWKWHKGYVPASKGHDTDRRYAPGSGSQVIITTVKHKPGVSAGGNRTSGARSILGGNQVVAPITAPINVCGNAIGVLGDAYAGCRGGAVVKGRLGRWQPHLGRPEHPGWQPGGRPDHRADQRLRQRHRRPRRCQGGLPG